MTDRRSPSISSRKQPRQARSSDLVAAILEAAAQVLASEGAARFTTARVAEKAGVSVGSLYQYFPNKAAILFRLQSDEWRQTTGLLRGILEEGGTPPRETSRVSVKTWTLGSTLARGATTMTAGSTRSYRLKRRRSDPPSIRPPVSESGALYI